MPCKLLLLVAVALAAQPIFAEEPFHPVPFKLEVPLPVKSSAAAEVPGVCVAFPLGKVRIDYGTPLLRSPDVPRSYFPKLDAPGAGYREQSARMIPESRGT
jgi:hypothetical protein